MSLIEDWKEFYGDYFSLEKDFSNLVIPKHVRGFDRLLVIAEGMAPNRLFSKCEELFPSRKYTEDLDIAVVSVRRPDHDYAVWVRDRIKADEENKNKSTEDLQFEGVNGITLEERLIYELKYFKETGKHLDMLVVASTLCSGSRTLGGAPVVYWFDYKVVIGWRDLECSTWDLRARSVVY